MQAISDYLYGITIDHYVAMNMDAIAILNDAVGGVTVNVTDDFSQVDPTIGKGKVILTGQQALHYIRSRQGLGDQLNVSRMARHREYAQGFMDSFRKAREASAEFLVTTYDAMLPYMVTDCSVNTLSGFVDHYSGYTVNPPITPEGESKLGEQYYEFYADEAKLDALILEMFFAPKK
jgi:anionic cell wall polymer biosynthesis LytR-Cps2A-Psr (LCP) family protein